MTNSNFSQCNINKLIYYEKTYYEMSIVEYKQVLLVEVQLKHIK